MNKLLEGLAPARKKVEEQLARLTPPQRQTAMTLAALAGLALAVGVVYVPLLGWVRGRDRELADLRARIADASGLEGRIRAEEEAVKKARRSKERMEERMDMSLPRILEALDAESRSRRLDLAVVQSKEEESEESAPLRVDLKGSYSAIGDFLGWLNTAPFPASVRRLELAKRSPDDTLHAQVGLSTAAGGAAPPAAAREAQRRRAGELAWARDPFDASAPAGAQGGLRCSGILWDPRQPMAVINGQTLKVGEEVQGCRIVEIGPDHVILESGGRSLRLDVGISSEGGEP